MVTTSNEDVDNLTSKMSKIRDDTKGKQSVSASSDGNVSNTGSSQLSSSVSSSSKTIRVTGDNSGAGSQEKENEKSWNSNQNKVIHNFNDFRYSSNTKTEKYILLNVDRLTDAEEAEAKKHIQETADCNCIPVGFKKNGGKHRLFIYRVANKNNLQQMYDECKEEKGNENMYVKPRSYHYLDGDDEDDNEQEENNSGRRVGNTAARTGSVLNSYSSQSSNTISTSAFGGGGKGRGSGATNTLRNNDASQDDDNESDDEGEKLYCFDPTEEEMRAMHEIMKELVLPGTQLRKGQKHIDLNYKRDDSGRDK